MAVAATGHRPQKMGLGYYLTDSALIKYQEMLEPVLEELINKGHDKFYSGGAQGWDQVFFFTVDKLKSKYPNIVNIIAIPYKNFPSIWKSEKAYERYYLMKRKADKIVYVDTLPEYNDSTVPEGDYSVKKLTLRNRYLVDKTEVLVALTNGSLGGTENCINYALYCKKEIIKLEPLKFND